VGGAARGGRHDDGDGPFGPGRRDRGGRAQQNTGRRGGPTNRRHACLLPVVWRGVRAMPRGFFMALVCWPSGGIAYFLLPKPVFRRGEVGRAGQSLDSRRRLGSSSPWRASKG